MSETVERLESRRMLSIALVSSAVAPNTQPPVANGSAWLFTGSGEGKGIELWRTDGTPAGTWRLTDLKVNGDSDPTLLGNAGPWTLFFADSLNGRELWRTDGTAEGTTLVKDINPGSASSQRPFAYTHAQPPDNAIAINGIVYFQASDGAHGLELWRSDGTADGTWMVKDIFSGVGQSGICYQARMGDAIYFQASDASGVAALWKSDGTAEGTVRIGDPALGGPVGATEITPAGGRIFFGGYRTTIGYELWASDGTAIGTCLVRDIAPTTSNTKPASLTPVGDGVFFSHDDGVHGVELWHSDGTFDGTQLVRDINPGSAGSNPTWTGGYGDQLIFSASDGTHGLELWASDGTNAGTRLVKDLRPGSGSSVPRNKYVLDGSAWFVTNSGGVWRSDATEAGTWQEAQIGSSLLMTALLGVSGSMILAKGYVSSTGALYRIGAPPVQQAAAQPDGTLLVEGTTFSDQINITRSGETLTVTLADGPHAFSASSLTQVVVKGYAGADMLTCGALTGLPLRYEGGDGGEKNVTDTLILTGGTHAFASEAGLGLFPLSLTVQGPAEARFASTQHLANLSVSGRAVMEPGAGYLHAQSLAISPNGTLDLNDSDLVIESGVSFAEARNLLLDGAITSSAGQLAGNTILALLDNSLLGAGDWPLGSGNAIPPGAIVGKHALLGDMNLDGSITADDYALLDANLGTTPPPGLAWLSGDANLDGEVTSDDYAILDANLS